MPTALTYRTSEKRSALRTVVVDNVRGSVVLLPTGSLDVVTATLLCGSQCATPFWHEQLGTSGADFAVTADQVVAGRPITVAALAKHQH